MQLIDLEKINEGQFYKLMTKGARCIIAGVVAEVRELKTKDQSRTWRTLVNVKTMGLTFEVIADDFAAKPRNDWPLKAGQQVVVEASAESGMNGRAEFLGMDYKVLQ